MPDSAITRLQRWDRKARLAATRAVGEMASCPMPVNQAALMVILMTMTTLSLAEAKSHLSELVGRVNTQHERVTCGLQWLTQPTGLL